MTRKKLAVCAILRNEAPYLAEWLAFHRIVGVDHFVLYDNDSTDDPGRVIRSSPLAEHVTLINWPQRPGRLAAYRHFIDLFSLGFEWAAFIDLDEFLLPLNSRSVVDTLERLNSAAAVLVHWRVFGPGPWEEPPPGLVIENYDQRAADDFPTNRHIKSIVRCSELLDVAGNRHEFQVKGPVFNAAGHLVPNIAIQERPCYQNLVINHYYTRSRQDWQAKLQRGDAMSDDPTPKYEAGAFDHLAEMCRTRDDTIKAFAPAVRDLLGFGSAASRPPSQEFSPYPVATESVAAAFTAALLARAAQSLDARPAQPPQPDAAVFRQMPATPAWVSRGQDAQERTGGVGLVFRDRSRPGEHWLAALRGAAVAAIDPSFLLDEFDRIRDFSSDAEARAACDAALDEMHA